jgi:hypothetical protein
MTNPHNVQSAPSARRERVLGFLLCVLGSGLAIGMSIAAWKTAPTFLNPGQLIDGDRFSGSALQGQQALALILAIALTGVAFAAMGAHRLRTGRRDKRMNWVVVVPLVIVAVAAWQIRSWP